MLNTTQSLWMYGLLATLISACGATTSGSGSTETNEQGSSGKTAAVETSANDEASGPVAEKITDGVFVVHGPLELPNKTNRGFMNNPGFVLTDAGVVVVDPGGSKAVGEMLLAQIRKQTNQPVVAVFDTHAHGDHWLGNGAIKEAYPKAVIYAHPAMKAEVDGGAGERWAKNLANLTEGTWPTTDPVGPDETVDNGAALEIGGLHFRVHHTGVAHTKGDLMIEVVERKVIFLGDNGSHNRILRLDDGSFKGNIAALDHALAAGMEFFVPGHGPSGGLEACKGYRDYLAAVRAGVEKLYDEGLQDFEMKPKLEPSLTAWKDWAGFDLELGKHISLCYHEVEIEKF